MGTRGRAIVKMDCDKLLNLLNKAFSDEWLAYYQYWIAAQIIEGPMKDAAIAELNEHAADELRHAQMLSDRICNIGGTPVLEPKAWYELTNCGYEAPTDPFIEKILEQNIKAEQCAIDVYDELMDITKDGDPVTYNLALQILEDEVEHEEDLQQLLEDLNVFLNKK